MIGKGGGGGGISIYVTNGIEFSEREELGYFDEELEALFIDIDKEELGTDKNTIVGVSYRIPGTSAENFNHKIERSLSRISHENKLLLFDGRHKYGPPKVRYT